jgi:hypothetical protein
MNITTLPLICRRLTRQAATDDELISLKEVQRIFEAHGRSVTERTLQRYCDKKQLIGDKQLTAEGQKWFVRKSSVFRCFNPSLRSVGTFGRVPGSRRIESKGFFGASGTIPAENVYAHD